MNNVNGSTDFEKVLTSSQNPLAGVSHNVNEGQINKLISAHSGSHDNTNLIEKSLNQTNSNAQNNLSIYDHVKLSESYFNKDMRNITNLNLYDVAPNKSFERQKDNILKMAGQVSNENLIRQVSPTDINKQRSKVKTSE